MGSNRGPKLETTVLKKRFLNSDLIILHGTLEISYTLTHTKRGVLLKEGV